MKKYILCICIASFNKAEKTYDLVTNILSNKNPMLCVLVADNRSNDGTVALLDTIKDERFSYIVNSENIGGAKNFVKAVTSGPAVFKLYCNERDLILPEKLDDFISFLETHEYLRGGWCVRSPRPEPSDFFELSTKEALLSLCFRCEHPTGFFYNSAAIDMLPYNDIVEYCDNTGFVTFPWEYMQAEVSCMGKTAVYNSVIWQSTGDTTHNKYVSSYSSLRDDDNDRWFSLQNCLNRAVSNIDHFYRLYSQHDVNMSVEERYAAFGRIILAQQRICVWRRKQIFETESLAYHYAVKTHRVPGAELRQISKQITKAAITHIRSETGTASSYEKLIYKAINTSDHEAYKAMLIKKIAGLRLVMAVRKALK